MSNKGTASLSNASQAAAKAGYGAARTAMKKFKDEEGRSLNVSPNVLLVGPALLEDVANCCSPTRSSRTTPRTPSSALLSW
ncbi:Mu-like prophage major head subunit gpT family protein [Pseudomonas aeruginosa]|uniref:Mu-like prophage major head subunit gpT family protein n=1 Tax=Pseudomonas aeruginosa TaxID=287 RepID=UPI0030F2E078